MFSIYDDSLEQVTEAMKINLGLIEPELIKEFSFDINTPYEETVIGKEVSSTKTNSGSKLPDFTGDTEVQARKTASKLGISLKFKYVTEGSGKVGTVIAQNYKKGTAISSPLATWWGDVEGGNAINSVRFTSQSSSEPVLLDYELHKCFSVLISKPLVGQHG